MATVTALERRIKTQVTGRIRRFYAVAGPGLEELCRGEIAGLLPPPTAPTAGDGGVDFEARLHEAYAVNLWSATASRVLMRLGDFAADGFGRLRRKAGGFPWELYLPAGAPLVVHAALHRSRLYHREAVAERIRESVEESLVPFAPEPGEAPADLLPQHLYVRAVKDVFTLSLDMSGEHLHKRGVKTRKGRAPLRETVAAGVLRLAGYDGRRPLLDPMCGTGTFSLEAAMMAKRIPPGGFRRFAFEQWPGFRPGRWTHLKRLAREGVRRLEAPLVFASDVRSPMVGGLKEAVRAADMEDAVRVRRMDFFDLSPGKICGEKGLLALNPPYGRRLGTPQESERLFGEIGRKIRRDFRGWRVALLAPAEAIEKNARIQGKRTPLFHGGLGLSLTVADIA